MGEQAMLILSKHWMDFIFSFLLFITKDIISAASTPHDRIFFEQDPTLSYPYEANEEVPLDLLMVVMVHIPTIMFLIMPVIYNKFWRSKNKPPRTGHLQYDAFRPFLFFVQAMSLNMVITNFVKYYVGRKRPNFFAICDYHGYRSAIDGNATAMKEYKSLTSLFAIGNISHCRASEEKIIEGMKSFPSGHSSSAYCSMWALSLWLKGSLNFGAKHKMWKLILIIIPIFSAWAIACTRTRDNWHNFDDILGGVVVGMSSASLIYNINFVEGIRLPLWFRRDNLQTESNSDSM